MKKMILVILYILLTITGLVLMKLGGNTGSILIENMSFSFTMNFISLIGFISYILSFLLFTNIVVKFDLSYIMPITSGLIQVLTLLSGFFIFNEVISTKGIIGASLVICGIIVMNIKIKKENDKIQSDAVKQN